MTATIVNARALSDTRIRVDWSAALDRNTQLEDVANWSLATAVSGAVVPAVLAVDVPDIDAPRFVELVTGEHTDSTAYTVAASASVTSGGLPVSTAPANYTGSGTDPGILVVVATSSTTCEVRFSEAIRDTASVRNASNWSFNLGLSVAAVTDVGEGIVSLETSEQDEDSLYTLTANATATDFANNSWTPGATSPMLGYQGESLADPALKLRVYNFLLEGIRAEDQENAQFWERFLEGPQSIWSILTDTILLIPSLWDVSSIQDQFLEHLQRIVGWTPNLAQKVTARLDYDTLRRLISLSVAFWKVRGSEDSIQELLSVVTNNRSRVLNWFHYRWLVGETQAGEDHDGIDPWLEPDASSYNVRIVDRPFLDRPLFRELIKLTRPTGERVDITYLGFLDLFEVDGDKAQWTDGAGVSSVSDGLLKLDTDSVSQETHVSVDDSGNWREYVVTFKAKGSSDYVFEFYRSSLTDQYELRKIAGSSSVQLRSLVAGTPSVITTVDLEAVYGERIEDDVFYSWRIEIVDEGATNRIRIHWESEQIISTTNGDHAEGSIGVSHWNTAGAKIEVDEVELIFLPATTETIEINT